MDSALRPYQVAHYRAILDALRRRDSALDASDTGTGKTYVALFLCKAFRITPLVIGTKAGRRSWERAAAIIGVEIEYCNYEKIRGRRKVSPAAQAAYKFKMAELARREEKALAEGTEPPAPEEYPPAPRGVAKSEWIEEVLYSRGSAVRWKNAYQFMIFDEAHRCGGSTSLNSKLLIAARRQAEFVLGLSATAADDPRQMKALGYALGLHSLSSRTQPPYLPFMPTWLCRHGCKPGVFGGYDFTEDREKQKQVFEQLHKELFPRCGSRMRKTEIPGFPRTTIETKFLVDEGLLAAKLTEEIHQTNADKGGLIQARETQQKLELLKVPQLVSLAEDYAQTSGVVIFLNFTEPLKECYAALTKAFGPDKVGYVDGSQAGQVGELMRRKFLDDFQHNRRVALVCNIQAGGESADMHDPFTQRDRTTLISPCCSGRQFKQVVGRVNRDGGGFSQQFVVLFSDTREEEIAARMEAKGYNIDLLNDGDLLI